MPVEPQIATPWFKVRHRYNIYIDQVTVTKESSAYVWVAWSSSDISKGYPGTQCKKISEDTSYFNSLDKAMVFVRTVIHDRRVDLQKKLADLAMQETEVEVYYIKMKESE